ncbi:dimethylarginine dimethylaminohydrolase family protein [Streptomyces spororaveus]|uniref:dimethylarginine dimethylaminohydrolase family protein n=1 Tax=Streptomyces spororaveus TaxID=284039 RepID=UPI00378A4FDC
MLIPQATTEYGTLRTVAMRRAGDHVRDLADPHTDPVFDRQQATSTWNDYQPKAVRAQQDALIHLLRDRGIEVILLEDAPGCTAQHYPRDLGFVIDHILVLARLNSAHRRPETDALTRLFPDNPHAVHLPEGTIEGGDVVLHTGTVLVGLSEETSPAGARALQRALTASGIDREVKTLSFSVPGIVHLDDHFNIVAPGTALIHRTVFPPAELAWIEQHFDLIDVSDAEALAVQANVLAIAPGTVVVAAGSDRITAQLAARGIEVLTVDYSEVTRIPGSLRCTTLPLIRD